MMNNLSNYILEKLKIDKNTKYHNYRFEPKTKAELISLIENRIKEDGNNVDLNDINLKNITDISGLFTKSNLSDFNGDISEWDVRNVEYMRYAFEGSKFNGDISKWDVSNVIDMQGMFRLSNFNGDISKWDVNNVIDMESMFEYSKFSGDISSWDVKNVKNMKHMFKHSPLVRKKPIWYHE